MNALNRLSHSKDTPQVILTSHLEQVRSEATMISECLYGTQSEVREYVVWNLRHKIVDSTSFTDRVPAILVRVEWSLQETIKEGLLEGNFIGFL